MARYDSSAYEQDAHGNGAYIVDVQTESCGPHNAQLHSPQQLGRLLVADTGVLHLNVLFQLADEAL